MSLLDCQRRTSATAGSILACVLFALSYATGVGAASSSSNPEVRTEASARLSKVGEARLKVLLWSIYDSRLYTPSGEYVEGERPLRLEIQYLRNVKAKALIEQTQKEWQAMGREHPRQEQWLGKLGELWPDIQAQDVLTLELDADNAATFLHNGVAIGRFDDPDFGQHFVDIWVSEDCTRPELRLSLLGKD
ncbi:MAG: chalcone isomerase family protein [Congregibacter sp.]